MKSVKLSEKLITPDPMNPESKSQRKVVHKVIALTRREKQLLQFLACGLTTKNIADKLFLSVNTIETHRKNILNKLGANNITEAVAIALRKGLIE